MGLQRVGHDLVTFTQINLGLLFKTVTKTILKIGGSRGKIIEYYLILFSFCYEGRPLPPFLCVTESMAR